MLAARSPALQASAYFRSLVSAQKSQSYDQPQASRFAVETFFPRRFSPARNLSQPCRS